VAAKREMSEGNRFGNVRISLTYLLTYLMLGFHHIDRLPPPTTPPVFFAAESPTNSSRDIRTHAATTGSVESATQPGKC